MRLWLHISRAVVCGAITWVVPPGAARNVDLSTVPPRDGVQLTIYNSEDLTLVRERRTLSFKPGANPLQFSWANTLIDPTSVELRIVTQADKLTLLDTMFPHDRPQVLYWNVQSELDGEATVEITYFTSGISWSADYVVIAGEDEATASVESFVRVFNNSGEDYENAEVRLVVGTINLVEKIAELARVPVTEVNKLGDGVYLGLRQDAMRRVVARAELASTAGRPGLDEVASQPKEIVKEGLSEYFIYTIEGTETVPNGWSKRLRSFEAADVPLRVQYRYRPAEYGDQLVRLYLMTNDTESQLGTTPLPDGQVRIFRENGRGGLSFVAAVPTRYIPIGDKFELNLGQDPRVIFELIKLRSWRDEVWMHIHGADVFRRVGDGRLKVDVAASVAGWDEHQLLTQRIRNYTERPIEVEVRRAYGGHVVFRSALEPRLHDYQTVELRTSVGAGEQQDLYHEVVYKLGRNASQNNVTLEAAQVGP